MNALFLAFAMWLALPAAPESSFSITFTNQGNLSGGLGRGGTVSTVDSFTVAGVPITNFPLGLLTFDTGSLQGGFKNGGNFTDGNFKFTATGGQVFFETKMSGSWSKVREGQYKLVGNFSGVQNGTHYTGTTTQLFGSQGDASSKESDDDHLVNLSGTTTVKVP
jgi:hypothetical protein